MPLAKEIVVDRDENGAPRITIDGEVFPWFTAGIVPSVPALDKTPTLTLTILADKVTTIDAASPRWDGWRILHDALNAEDAGEPTPDGG